MDNMLTGKCKEAFEKWYLQTIEPKIGNLELLSKTVKFYLLPTSMQYGVYVDFFDSVNSNISMQFNEKSKTWSWFISKVNSNSLWNDYGIKTRHEARTKSTEKANEIFNNGK